MSVYNREDLVERAIESILNQTFTDFEFIIIDDGSTDRTAEILDGFARKDNRIRVIHQENTGLARALNRGIMEARGPLIARMDDDDTSFPERFEKQVNFLDMHPEVACLGTWARIVDHENKPRGEMQPPVDHDTIRKNMLLASQFIHPTVMMRRDAIMSIGLYTDLRAEDYDLFMRLVYHYRTANLPEVLLNYRFAADNYYSSKTKRMELSSIYTRMRPFYAYREPLWRAVHLIRPILSYLIPIPIKRAILKLQQRF